MKAFILAAGLGTRLRPITDSIPKALIQLNGKTLLEICIERLKSFGFTELVINVHHFSDQITNFLADKKFFGVDIKISDESKLLLDTGGALNKAAFLLNDEKPFLVHNVDIISDINLTQLYQSQLDSKNIVTLAVQKRKSSRYFLFDEENCLCGWKNEKTGELRITREPSGMLNSFAFSGIHVADSKIFELMPQNDIFSLVDFYLSLAPKNIISYFDHTGSVFFDLGKKENLSEAEKIIT
jgi:NDP-sugar pyrophosphorylase family protein